MVDHHVDRPGVEVRQRMQLTGTNSSIDLITPIYNIHQAKLDVSSVLTLSRLTPLRSGRGGASAPARSRVLIVICTKDGKANEAVSKHTPLLPYSPTALTQLLICVLRRPGGYGGAAAPDPFPNSAVKRSSANGTSSQDAGE